MKVYSISSSICSSKNSVAEDKYCSCINSNTEKMQKHKIEFLGKPKKYYLSLGDMLSDKIASAWKALKEWNKVEQKDILDMTSEERDEMERIRWHDNVL